MTELAMTPEQAREMWEKHQPDNFIETMQDWQSSGPNEINLVDEFVLKPIRLPPCPDKQDPDAPAPEDDPQDTEDTAL